MLADQNQTNVLLDLLKKYDRPGPRYTSYPTAPVWSEDVQADAYRSALKNAGTDRSPLALYCHIPFCRKRCFYCGCNTCVSNNQARATEYVRTVANEIEATTGLLERRTAVSQLHLGGGTPTFLDVDGFGLLLDKLHESFEFESECEKSIELDPRVTTPEQLDFLASRGFNRASLGVQDFDPNVQEAIGRVQPLEQVQAILIKCRQLGFKGINFDLIYGLPRQTPESFAQTLDTTISLRPDRLAVYSFAYLPNMKSNQLKIDPNQLPDAEMKYQLFALAIEKFTAAGYRQIGMDHFALPEDELSLAQSDGRLHRNFMGYTVQTAPEMIGLGMSSIGYVDNAFFQNLSGLESYEQAIADNGVAVYRGLRLSEDDLIRQYLISSLMCNFKLDYESLEERFGIEYKKYFANEHKRLDTFDEDGFIEVTPSGIQITKLGRSFVRNIAMIYDAYLREDGTSPKATFSRTI
jgi:oxygen-independent coproporphyrinogen-3 oxidase